MALFNSHQGSWFGLPDFGVTEAVGGFFGAPRNTQGGSNIVPSFNAQVQGVSTTNNAPINWQSSADQEQLAAFDKDNRAGSGASGAGGNNAPTFTTNTGQVLSQKDWENSSQYKFEQAQANGQNQLRNDISSGWDNYTNSLNDILNNGLRGQRAAQEGIANSQYEQGMSQLGLQNTQGVQQLGQQRNLAEQNQTKTLRDLSANVRNAFQAGNNFLGARGAGDSSAADQYSYALTKQGNQQRGDVMNNTANILSEIGGRETNLKNIYDTEVKGLGAQRNQQLNQVASWFADAQNQLKQQIAQGGLNKSQDLNNLSKGLLDQGLAQIQSINQNSQARYNALTQWAAVQSKDIASLRGNMQQISQFAPQLPGFSQIGGAPQVDSQGNFFVPSGYGSSNEQNKNKSIFG